MRTRVLICAALAVALASCADGDVDATVDPTGTTITEDPHAGPRGCADWAAEPPTPEERAEGCVGDNGDLYLDAARSVPYCEEWLERPVTATDVAEGCRAGRVELATTADRPCADGRVLYWNQVVWGYVGEPARSYPPGAPESAPDDARAACEG